MRTARLLAEDPAQIAEDQKRENADDLPYTACRRTGRASVADRLATPGNMAKEAVNANQAIKQQNNNLLLLNILRASKELPLHFSRINTLRLTAGEAGLSASKLIYPGIGAAAAPGQSFTRKLGAELGVTGAALPALDVTPLDGQEFMQGIMAPVPSSVLPLMSELGWRPQLLMRLLVDSIAITDEADKVVILQNDPGIKDDFKKFTAFVDAVADGNCIFLPKSGTATRFSPDYRVGQAASPSLEGVAAAKANGLSPELAGDGTFYYGVTPKFVEIKCTDADAEAEAVTPYAATSKALVQELSTRSKPTSKDPLGSQLRALLSIRPRVGEGGAVAPTPVPAKPNGKPPQDAKPKEISARLRSPYGVLVYLGSLLKTNQPGFTVSRGINPDKTAAVATAELLGETYFIPAESARNGDDTIRSLSIAWQLLQLQSKGSTAPVTGTVRITQ